ncbi:MAG: hypothetical protein WDO74_17920 [Pseudomonadota bacterium]
MAGKSVTYTKGDTAFVKDNVGNISRVDASKAAALLSDPDEAYLPATEADVSRARRHEENQTLGGKAKTFAESAAAGAIDAAQAPLMAPYRLGRAALGVEGPDASQEIGGRKTVESLATLWGDIKERANPAVLKPGESGGQTGESYGREYGENARGRAEDNPLTATAGQVAGALATGGGLSGGARAAGAGVAEGLGGGLAARAAGAVTSGALEGAAYGSAAAGEEAYLHDIPLTGEKVIASMGLGAILGGAVSLSAEGLGAVLRRGVPKTAEAGETALVDGVEMAATPGSFSTSLREFADERTAKALGARASDLKKLGRTAEKAESELHAMSRTVRNMELDDGTKVFQGIQSQEDLADRVLRARNETGAKLSNFRAKADEVFESHPEIAPDAKAIADRIRKELVEPLANHPLSASRSQAAPISQLADDIEALGARAANDNGRGAGISDLTKLRQGLDDQIYQTKRGVNLTQQGAPPQLKDLERARGILEEQIEASTDKAAQYFEKASEQSYKEIKTQWRQLNLASEISGAASLQDLGNRVISPSDYAAGAATMVGDMATGGGFSMIKGALATAGHQAIREHASSVFAVLADRLANTLDGKIDSGLSGFFKEAVQRGSLGSMGEKAGALAKSVPLKRAMTPTAVTAFLGKHGDLSTAYQRRVDDVLAANRDVGATGLLRQAMGGAYGALPKLSQAATITAANGAAYLASQIPGGTRSPTVFSPLKRSTPSDLEIRQFAQKWAAVSNPLGVIDDLRKGTVTHAQVDAIKAVYPALYEQIQASTLEKLRDLDAAGKTIPFQDRLQLDLFLDLNGAGEPTLSGKFIDRVSAVQARKQQQQVKPPAASAAALTKLGASMAPGSDALSQP